MAQSRASNHPRPGRDRIAPDGSPDLASQEVILTVPASFDAAARDLTLEAALAAGFDNVHLLEEPQAALYAWIESMGDGFRSQLKVGDVVLVVDVGGGSGSEATGCDGDKTRSTSAVAGHTILVGAPALDRSTTEQSATVPARIGDRSGVTSAGNDARQRGGPKGAYYGLDKLPPALNGMVAEDRTSKAAAGSNGDRIIDGLH